MTWKVHAAPLALSLADPRRGPVLADKSTQLILTALSRAATDPTGLPLYAQKTDPGLFPATTIAKTAADRAKAEGLLQVVEVESRGKASRELCTLTEKGMQFLVRQSNPREVLEDFVRVLESRSADVAELEESVGRMTTSLQTIRQAVEQILPRLNPHAQTNSVHHESASTKLDSLIADIKARLSEWHASGGAQADCPLPELYRKLDGAVSIGQFHDALRQLHDDHQIYLHPWTGPLYALPEPSLALLVGHEVAYYASIR